MLPPAARESGVDASVPLESRAVCSRPEPPARPALVPAPAPLAPASITTVRLEGCAAELLLPRDTPFDRYVAALIAQRVFPAHVDELERIAAQPHTSAPFAPDPARPNVVILVPAPKHLLPNAMTQVACLIRKTHAMGCRPLLVPPCADILDPGRREEVIDAVLAHADGVFGPGGDDVAPEIYGEPNRHAVNTNPVRDAFERDLALGALERPIFLFGICRSHQLWNAASGGDLVQDVQAEGYSRISQDQREHGLSPAQPFIVRDERGAILFQNEVELEPTSRTARVTGVQRLVTNSLHHQAVRTPGRGFVPTGFVRDPHTGVITIEVTERWNAITVQFHPELMPDDPHEQRLLDALGRRARIVRRMKDLGGVGGVAALLAAMEAEAAFEPCDFHWVKEELAARWPF